MCDFFGIIGILQPQDFKLYETSSTQKKTKIFN